MKGTDTIPAVNSPPALFPRTPPAVKPPLGLMLSCGTAQRAVAQVHQAEAALRAAIQYDEALTRNKAAAKTSMAPWSRDARGAHPGYAPGSPMMSRPQVGPGHWRHP